MGELFIRRPCHARLSRRYHWVGCGVVWMFTALGVSAEPTAAQPSALGIVRVDASRPCSCVLRLDSLGHLGGEQSASPFPAQPRHIEKVGPDRY